MKMMSPHIQTYPHGTPMTTISSSNNDTNNRISVASFNLLAPLYIRPIDQRTGKIQPFASFDWISEEDSERILGNDVRLPKLLQRMLSCGSDFICVQELQLEREEGKEVDSSQSQAQQLTMGKRSRKEDSDLNDNLPMPTTQEFVLPKWIRPMIQSSTSNENDGPYKIILPPQTELEKIAERNRRVLLEDVAITNAIFYKSEKWNPVWNRGGGFSVNSTTTCVTQAFRPVGGEQENGVDSDLSVITSIHLDACSEEKRFQQLQRCLEQSLSFSATPYIPPCIIAGDFNCELFDGSCINAFLAKGECEVNSTELSTSSQPLDEDNHAGNRMKECAAALRLPSGTIPSKEQLQSWDELHDTVTKFKHDHFLTLKRIDSGCTRVAYDHDISDENPRTMAMWHLDHILYTPSTLVPVGKWSSLEDDEHSSKVGLPNDHVPTDHLPIAAMFERRTHPQLSEESKEKLVKSLNEMENRHEMEVKTKNEEVEQKRAELEQQQVLEKKGNESTEIESQPSKKSKKKKTRPSPEMIQHIRNSRSIIKGLKVVQQIERQQFINERTLLERMVLQHALGRDVTCAKWIESGRADK